MPKKKVPYDTLLNRTGELYTPKDEAFFELMEELRIHVGGQWKDIARQSRLSTRYMRRLRSREWVTVSYKVMDKVLTRCGLPHRISDLPWYTPEQLVEIGVWKPHNTSGLMLPWNHSDRVIRRSGKRRARSAD